MKKNHLVFIVSMIIAGVLAVGACKKEEEKTVTKQDAAVIAKNDAVSDASYNDIYSESEDILSVMESNKYSSSALKSGSVTGTRTITVTKNSGDTTKFPKEITVVYNNYKSASGLLKNGTIKITQSARMRKAGAVRVVTLQNFTINDSISLEGTKTITNMGLVDGKPSIKVQLENGIVTFDSGNYFTRSFTRTITWKEGFSLVSLFYIWDDVYAFNETAKGSSKNGLSYTATTTVPLEYRIGELCIKKGQIDINIEDQLTVKLDFTRTTCLEKVKFTIEGETQSFDIW